METLKEKYWPRIQHQEIIFQQNCTSAHHGRVVREWINEKFGEKWIDRHGFIKWPPRSPDLSSGDFFLRVVLKDGVYRRKPRSIEELKNAITTEISAINSIFVKGVLLGD